MAKSIAFNIYSRLPVWSQNICCSLAGFKMVHDRYNKTFHEFLDFLEKSQWWSLSELEEFQNEKLRDIIRHAYHTVKYYREVMDQSKLRPEDIKTVQDLPKLPILTKQILRERTEDLLSNAIPLNRMVRGKTGGTTGTALKLYYDRNTCPRQWALVWRGRRRWGIDYRSEFISFAGRLVVPLTSMGPPFWRRNYPYRQTYVSVHHLTKKNLPVLAEYLCNREVDYYSGYPSGIYIIARYFVDNSLTLPHPPKIVFTCSETLSAHQRAVISEAFCCPVTDFYQASEHCVGISTCEDNVYHQDMEFGAIELLPLPNGPQRLRKVICTGFWNLAMPLIRYEIDDLVSEPKSDSCCTCGRSSLTVEAIDGRIESYILTPDGRQLGRLDFLFKQSDNIKEAQLVQTKISSVTVRLVKDNNYSTHDEKALLTDIRSYMGKEISIQFEYVSEIPREENGKFRQIVSKLDVNIHKD